MHKKSEQPGQESSRNLIVILGRFFFAVKEKRFTIKLMKNSE
jgi:hypothetical protein